MSIFDNAARWNDHTELGHMIGLLPWVMWIPAAIARVGAQLIVATVTLLVLFQAQYALINGGSTVAQALHPLNGAVLLVLGFWITQRSIGSLRTRPSECPT